MYTILWVHEYAKTQRYKRMHMQYTTCTVRKYIPAMKSKKHMPWISFLKGVQLFSQSRTSWSMLVVLVVRSGSVWLLDELRSKYMIQYVLGTSTVYCNSMLFTIAIKRRNELAQSLWKGEGSVQPHVPTNQPTRHAVAPQVLPVAPIPAPARRSELTGTPSWMCNTYIYICILLWIYCIYC